MSDQENLKDVVLTVPEEAAKNAFEDTSLPQDLVEEFTGEFNPNEVKFMIYGESGAGKTVLASTFPDPVFLDIDKGMASVRRKVHRIPVNNWFDLQRAFVFLQEGKHPFKTVVVDSLNEMQKISIDNVVASFPSIRRSYNNLVSQSDWGKILADCDSFVRAMRGLPMNVVFITQVATRQYETDPVMPQLSGKNTARTYARMMDIIGYIERASDDENRKKRHIIFDAPNFVTKDRSDKLPPIVEDPSYEIFLRYWKSA